MNGRACFGKTSKGLPSTAFLAAVFAWGASGARAADDPPLAIARDGFFYVGGKSVTLNGRPYMSGQMYVEFRIPAKQTRPFPIVMVHGGTMSGTNFTGTPDGREGWAQFFVRRGYAVYVVDQPGDVAMTDAEKGVTCRRPASTANLRCASCHSGFCPDADALGVSRRH